MPSASCCAPVALSGPLRVLVGAAYMPDRLRREHDRSSTCNYINPEGTRTWLLHSRTQNPWPGQLNLRRTRRRQGLVVFVSTIQSLLIFAHFVLYKTWTFQLAENAIPSKTWVGTILGVLCVSFVAASLLAFRYTNVFVRTFYRAAAVWMGLLSFLFLSSLLCWDHFRDSQPRLARNCTSITLRRCRRFHWLGAWVWQEFSTRVGRASRMRASTWKICRTYGADAKRR